MKAVDIQCRDYIFTKIELCFLLLLELTTDSWLWSIENHCRAIQKWSELFFKEPNHFKEPNSGDVKNDA